MNIDERLHRLTEKRAALAQTEESIAEDLRELRAAQRENEKQIAELVTFIGQLSGIALSPR
jgi:hypothetical protein